MEAWTVVLRDHHEDYITWEQYEHPARIQRNTFGKPAGDTAAGVVVDYTTAMFVSLQRASNHSYHSYSPSGLSC